MKKTAGETSPRRRHHDSLVECEIKDRLAQKQQIKEQRTRIKRGSKCFAIEH